MAEFRRACAVFVVLTVVPSIVICQSSSADDTGLLLDVAFDNTTGLQDRVCGLQPITMKGRPEMITVDAQMKIFDFGYSVTSRSPLAAYQFFPLNTGITICFYFFNFFNETAFNEDYVAKEPSGILRVNFGERLSYLSLWSDSAIYNKNINYVLVKNGEIIKSGTLTSYRNDWGYKCIALSRLQIHVAGYHVFGVQNSAAQSETSKLTTPFEPDYSGFEVRIGEAVTDKGVLVYMNKGDAIACLSVYDSALDDAITARVFNNYAPIRNCSVPPVNVSASCSQRKVAPEKIVRNNSSSNNKPVSWDNYVPPGMQGISGTTVNSKLETTTSSSNRLSSSTIAAFLLTVTSYFKLF